MNNNGKTNKKKNKNQKKKVDKEVQSVMNNARAIERHTSPNAVSSLPKTKPMRTYRVVADSYLRNALSMVMNPAGCTPIRIPQQEYVKTAVCKLRVCANPSQSSVARGINYPVGTGGFIARPQLYNCLLSLEERTSSLTSEDGYWNGLVSQQTPCFGMFGLDEGDGGSSRIGAMRLSTMGVYQNLVYPLSMGGDPVNTVPPWRVGSLGNAYYGHSVSVSNDTSGYALYVNLTLSFSSISTITNAVQIVIFRGTTQILSVLPSILAGTGQVQLAVSVATLGHTDFTGDNALSIRVTPAVTALEDVAVLAYDVSFFVNPGLSTQFNYFPYNPADTEYLTKIVGSYTVTAMSGLFTHVGPTLQDSGIIANKLFCGGFPPTMVYGTDANNLAAPQTINSMISDNKGRNGPLLEGGYTYYLGNPGSYNFRSRSDLQAEYSLPAIVCTYNNANTGTVVNPVRAQVDLVVEFTTQSMLFERDVSPLSQAFFKKIGILREEGLPTSMSNSHHVPYLSDVLNASTTMQDAKQDYVNEKNSEFFDGVKQLMPLLMLGSMFL